MTYLIDSKEKFDEGGYCQVYPIISHSNILFKEFSNLKKANYAIDIQRNLAQFDLAPRVYSDLCKLRFVSDNTIIGTSNWGYITELAGPAWYNTKAEKYNILRKIQVLVDSIYKIAKLKFWDCHYYNTGWVCRNGYTKLVCIDTGIESFDGYSDAWGMGSPGPKCSYCNKYQCKCSED